MSVFRCGMCDVLVDADLHGCYEHPTNDMECICNICYCDHCDENYCISECYE